MDLNSEPSGCHWGWVIVVCSLFNHVGTVGMMMSLSVLYVSWLDQFGEGKGATSWIISIGVTCMFGLCPIPANLAERFGFPAVSVLGSLLTALGLFASVFATSVSYLVVSVGLITGIGCCFAYLPSVTVVTTYFVKRRSLAMGLATAGTGLGSFGLPPLLSLLEEMYGWRGAMLILSGLSLNMCVTGLLFRSYKPPKSTGNLEHGKPNETNGDVSNDHQLLLDSGPILVSVVEAGADGVGDDEDNTQISEGTPADDGGAKLKSRLKDPRLRLLSQEKAPRLHVSSDDVRAEPRSKHPTHHHHSFQSLNLLSHDGRSQKSATRSLQNIDMAVLASMLRLSDNAQNKGNRGTLHGSEVLNTQEHSSSDIKRETRKETKQQSITTRILRSPLVQSNLKLLSDKLFFIFVISNFITNLSFFTPVVYMVDRAVFEGIDKTTGAILVSANGIGNIFGRIVFGFMADNVCSNRLFLYICALTMCGAATILSTQMGDVALLHAGYAALFGCLMGTYTVLAPLVTVDLMGLDKVHLAYGMVLFFMGVGNVIGPPLAGWLFDWSQSYDLSYLAIGLFFLISGFLLVPLFCCLSRRQRQRKMQEPADITLTGAVSNNSLSIE